MQKFRFFALFTILLFIGWQPKQQDFLPTVEVIYDKGKFVLYRYAKPYYIKGAGGHINMGKIALYGGNSIRTWSTQDADQILNEAHNHGLTVTLGLEVGKEWWGEDFNYWDFNAVDQKIAELKKVIEKHKDHPALLIWNVGNEVNLFGGNKLLVLHTIDRIAKMIQETDPNHPVMTTLTMGPNFDKLGLMRLITPNIDILGVNTFSRLPDLQKETKKLLGWKKAYIITEWGTPGHWEVNRTRWKSPIEPSSTERAKYMKYYWQIIKQDNKLCLGNYAFYWGHKYERTHTFFSLFTEDGLETESVNVLRSMWSPTYKGNQAPKIDSMQIHVNTPMHEVYLSADSLYQASIFAHDPDRDSLSYHWEIRPEGYDKHTPGSYDYSITHLLIKNNCSNIEFRAPEHPGPYRLFAFIYDGQQHVATQNIPFFTLPERPFPTNKQKKSPYF